jgi:hypothetical protein
MPPAITNIAAASAAAAALPQSIAVNLSSGLKIKLRRLSWRSFEKLWPKLAALLLELWASSDSSPEPSPSAGPQTGPFGSAGPHAGLSGSAGPQTGNSPHANQLSPSVAQRLLAVPGLLSELLTHCTDLKADELSELPLGDVLALSAAALRHNFIETAGLRDFFGALGELAA